MSPYTNAERYAILRGAREACATAADLQVTLAELRRAADRLRIEAEGLRFDSDRLRRSAEAARSEGGGLRLSSRRCGPRVAGAPAFLPALGRRTSG